LWTPHRSIDVPAMEPNQPICRHNIALTPTSPHFPIVGVRHTDPQPPAQQLRHWQATPAPAGKRDARTSQAPSRLLAPVRRTPWPPSISSDAATLHARRTQLVALGHSTKEASEHGHSARSAMPSARQNRDRVSAVTASFEHFRSPRCLRSARAPGFELE
jgi:hypothetical protein